MDKNRNDVKPNPHKSKQICVTKKKITTIVHDITKVALVAKEDNQDNEVINSPFIDYVMKINMTQLLMRKSFFLIILFYKKLIHFFLKNSFTKRSPIYSTRLNKLNTILLILNELY